MSGILKKPLRSSLRDLQPQPSPSHVERFTVGNENNTDLPFNVCRICLAMNIRMYDMMKHNLNVKYEKVTGLEILSDDKLPQKLCWECVARLNAANKLRKKALISRKLLLDKIKGNRFMTETDIKQIHGKQRIQKSSLGTHIHKPNTSYLHIVEYEMDSDDNNSYYHNNDSENIDLYTDDEEVIASLLFGSINRNLNINEKTKSKDLADKEMYTRDSKIAQERTLRAVEMGNGRNNEKTSSANKYCILSNELIYPIREEIVNSKLEEVEKDDEEIDFQLIYDTQEISTNTINTTITNSNIINVNTINQCPINTIDARLINTTPLNTRTIDAINTCKKEERSISAGSLNTIKTETNENDGDYEVSIKVEDYNEITVDNIQKNSTDNDISNMDTKRKRKTNTRLNRSCKKLRMEVKVILHDIGKDPVYEDFLKNRKTGKKKEFLKVKEKISLMRDIQMCTFLETDLQNIRNET